MEISKTTLHVKHGDTVEVITRNHHTIGHMDPTRSTNRFVAIYNAKNCVYHPLIQNSYFALGIRITDVISVIAIAPQKNWILGNGEMIESL